MKKLIMLLPLLFVSLVISAQRETINKLDKFNEVKVYDRIEVSLVKGNENKLIITGEDKDEVRISNKNGRLKIRMELDSFMSGNDVRVTLYYTEALTLLDVNENAKIISDETITGNRLELKGQEGGIITLDIQVDHLVTKSVTGSELTVTGHAKTQEVTVNTGGKAFLKKLTTEETEVVVTAGGSADVNASNLVKAKVKAGGSIYVYGHPKTIDQGKVFGGHIKRMD